MGGRRERSGFWISNHMEVSMRRFTVVCHWEGADQWEADADEITVSAESAAKAIAKARKQWRLTFGAEWPHLRLTESFILTKQNI
jgi:hypothetical protein